MTPSQFYATLLCHLMWYSAFPHAHDAVVSVPSVPNEPEPMFEIHREEFERRWGSAPRRYEASQVEPPYSAACFHRWYYKLDGSGEMGVHVMYRTRPGGVKRHLYLMCRLTGKNLEILWTRNGLTYANIITVLNGQNAEDILEVVNQREHVDGINAHNFSVYLERVHVVTPHQVLLQRSWPEPPEEGIFYEQEAVSLVHFPVLLLKPIMEKLQRVHPGAVPVFGAVAALEGAPAVMNAQQLGVFVGGGAAQPGVVMGGGAAQPGVVMGGRVAGPPMMAAGVSHEPVRQPGPSAVPVPALHKRSRPAKHRNVTTSVAPPDVRRPTNTCSSSADQLPQAQNQPINLFSFPACQTHLPVTPSLHPADSTSELQPTSIALANVGRPIDPSSSSADQFRQFMNQPINLFSFPAYQDPQPTIPSLHAADSNSQQQPISVALANVGRPNACSTSADQFPQAQSQPISLFSSPDYQTHVPTIPSPHPADSTSQQQPTSVAPAHGRHPIHTLFSSADMFPRLDSTERYGSVPRNPRPAGSISTQRTYLSTLPCSDTSEQRAVEGRCVSTPDPKANSIPHSPSVSSAFTSFLQASPDTASMQGPPFASNAHPNTHPGAAGSVPSRDMQRTGTGAKRRLILSNDEEVNTRGQALPDAADAHTPACLAPRMDMQRMSTGANTSLTCEGLNTWGQALPDASYAHPQVGLAPRTDMRQMGTGATTSFAANSSGGVHAWGAGLGVGLPSQLHVSRKRALPTPHTVCTDTESETDGRVKHRRTSASFETSIYERCGGLTIARDTTDDEGGQGPDTPAWSAISKRSHAG